MTSFLVCIHDATPAHARETEVMIRDLAPLVGQRLSFGVVPDWHGAWPLANHRGYCELLAGASEELLLHGYQHRRRAGSGAVSWLAESCDEMNGLDQEATHRVLRNAQEGLIDAFGRPARGFVAPGWQQGHTRAVARESGLEYVLGYFAIAHGGARLPLATWSWDCGRWSWLGYVGEGAGRLVHSLSRGIISLALHPRDLARGFWPRILHAVRRLLDRGCTPATPGQLVGPRNAEIAP
jgi:predicted deacetylase